jgi:hypothetical protein
MAVRNVPDGNGGFRQPDLPANLQGLFDRLATAESYFRTQAGIADSARTAGQKDTHLQNIDKALANIAQYLQGDSADSGV